MKELGRERILSYRQPSSRIPNLGRGIFKNPKSWERYLVWAVGNCTGVDRPTHAC